LIGELSTAYGASDRGITVDLNSEPISIDLERAAPLALAVTEAISNAFRAFASQLGGQFSLETNGGTVFRSLVPA
jgi:hypothetical protein